MEKEPNFRKRRFRKAVHIILVAIADRAEIAEQMLMKGGMLLAIRYNSTRFTRDIDFSTKKKYSEFDHEKFLDDFDAALERAGDRLDYNLSCKIQSVKLKPLKEDASFPTLKISIGYAKKDNMKQLKRLKALNSSDVVRVDYSFNELNRKIEKIQIEAGKNIFAYSITDLIAEKYRAILQQEKRNRSRRQDVYDIYFLINKIKITKEDKCIILESLIKKAESRELKISIASISEKSIIKRSKKDYDKLQDEIKEDLPGFDEAYGLVKAFYESMPWD